MSFARATAAVNPGSSQSWSPGPAGDTSKGVSQSSTRVIGSGFVMHRTQPWAPLEGGTFYGAGIGNPSLFPVEHEHWYVNMYWTSSARPARGTRMILRLPGTSRAVVVAAGYETGPGDLSFVGGPRAEGGQGDDADDHPRLNLRGDLGEEGEELRHDRPCCSAFAAASSAAPNHTRGS